MGKRSADKSRAILRRLAAQERERQALELYVKGKTYHDIGDVLDVTEGAAYKIVHRALVRRAAEEGPTVDAARVVYTARLEHLMSKWMPYADGTARDSLDEDTGRNRPGPPDARVGELVLKALDKWAAVNGVRAAVPSGDIADSGLPSPDEATVKINIVLAQLTTMREKATVIEGSLAAAGATIDGRAEGADVERTPPPPLEIEAAQPSFHLEEIVRDRRAA